MTNAPSVRVNGPLTIAGYAVGLVAQLVMISLGIAYILPGEETEASEIALGVWCGIGTVYVIIALIVLGRPSSLAPLSAPPLRSRLDVSRAVRRVAFTATILASIVGASAAGQLLGARNAPEQKPLAIVLGLWAMLLSWGFLHWGFANLYRQAFYSTDPRPLLFPQTEFPRLADFVYFSFTMGTSFAASDVTTLTTRLRWTITWHSVLSFFFNGLIVVLALNTITGG